MVAASLSVPGARAEEVPGFLKTLVVNEGPALSKEKEAFRDLKALNDAKYGIYQSALHKYMRHVRQRVPLIMALFSSEGGRLIFYKPGVEKPIEAPPPPQEYVMAKSVGHCAMATFELVGPYIGTAAQDSSWQAPMKAYRTRVESALAKLDNLDTTAENKELFRKVLDHIKGFMDNCLEKGSFTYEEVDQYGRNAKPFVSKLIHVAAQAQVTHWFNVMDGWKKELGDDWKNTYGLTNTIYVTRQNNVLFSILVQYFGKETINDRLLLLETTDFTTTPDDMLSLFTRIIADRALGEVFFQDYRLMDYELLGTGARAMIEEECKKRGREAVLPPLVPYNSNEWPWKSNTSYGHGNRTLEETDSPAK